MCSYPYYEVMRQSKDPNYIRYQMVLSVRQRGIKPTARLFRTTAKTVRKWLRRFEKSGWEGLKDQSRAPKHPARRITPQQRAKVIAIKKQLPGRGASRIRRDYDSQSLKSQKRPEGAQSPMEIV